LTCSRVSVRTATVSIHIDKLRSDGTSAGRATGAEETNVTESVTITDNRSGESLEIPILSGGVDAAQWKKLMGNIWFYDPGYTQTASTTSSITEIDGDAGILRYRGYPIEQLAKQSTYLEVAYLLVYGELPTTEQFDKWKHDITYHTFIHENVRKRFMDGFHYDAHPMGMLVSAVAALSTFYS
jgi:citrate synthase